MLECNVRVGRLEVDIVAQDGAVIALVEVRTRGKGSWQGPLGSIGAAKRARLRRAGQLLWSRRFRHMQGVERLRFDVAAVDLDSGPEPAVQYVRAAF